MTLPEILQRLRDEPKWEQISEDIITRKKCDSLLINEVVGNHNATRAQLLAVCDALESSIKLHDSHNDLPTVINITQKLAAALKL